MLAVDALSVSDTEPFNVLLRQIPREQNLWEVPRREVSTGRSADDLHRALADILAAKR